MPMIDVAVRYLELSSREAFRPKRVQRAGVTFGKVQEPMPELNRFFYVAVGGAYFWHDRLQWTRAQWMEYLTQPGAETWVLAVDGVPAGYVELVPRAEDVVEIALFGLLPAFVGQGLGAHMLTDAVERAWAMGATRVILDTCHLDHPRAFDNYAARGFREYKRGVRREDVPLTPPTPWSGT
jgi:GNAT superfamily N-acetyltransferase